MVSTVDLSRLTNLAVLCFISWIEMFLYKLEIKADQTILYSLQNQQFVRGKQNLC